MAIGVSIDEQRAWRGRRASLEGMVALASTTLRELLTPPDV